MNKKTKKTLSKSSNVPKALYEAPLVIGKEEIPCAVLDAGVRVLSQRRIFEAMNLISGGSKTTGARLPRFLAAPNLDGYISGELRSMEIIEYAPKTGRTAYGIRAEMLPLICEVFINADADDELRPHQRATAQKCRILQNGFARVGIIALIDEATGYEDIRAKNALAAILEEFLSKEVQQWTKTFPLDFYRQIYRLKKWKWEDLGNGKKPPTPGVVGQYTIDFVYKRIAPGVLEEAKKLNTGQSHKIHQWFNPEKGHPKLREHIAVVVGLMKASDNWMQCKAMVEKVFPKEWEKGTLFYKDKK